MNDKLKKCPCCGSEPKIISEDDIVHFGTDKWYSCSNTDCTYCYILLLPVDWQSRPLEESLQKEADNWRNTATVLSVKLKSAMEALKGISFLWHGRGLSPTVLEELDKTIVEIEGE